MVESGVKLHPIYGGTEFGIPFSQQDDEKDWAYMQVSERANVRWVPQGDGSFECQFLVRNTRTC